MGARAEVIDSLRALLREHFNARYEGALHPRTSRMQGHVDGYMDALLKAGVVTQRELLALVAEERTRAAGPALGSVSPSRVATASAF